MKKKKDGFSGENIFVYIGIAPLNPCFPLSSNMPDPFSCDFPFDHSDSKKPLSQLISVHLVRGLHGKIQTQFLIPRTINECHRELECHSLGCIIITKLMLIYLWAVHISCCNRKSRIVVDTPPRLRIRSLVQAVKN